MFVRRQLQVGFVSYNTQQQFCQILVLVLYKWTLCQVSDLCVTQMGQPLELEGVISLLPLLMNAVVIAISHTVRVGPQHQHELLFLWQIYSIIKYKIFSTQLFGFWGFYIKYALSQHILISLQKKKNNCRLQKRSTIFSIWCIAKQNVSQLS